MRQSVRLGLAAWAVIAVLMAGAAAQACPPPLPPPPPPPPLAPLAGELAPAYAERLAADAQKRLDAENARLAAERARVREWQQKLFDEADQVVLMRVRSSRLAAPPPSLRRYVSATIPHVQLEPMHWAKGASATRTVQLTIEGITDCGPIMQPAVTAGAGSEFVVFAGPGPIGANTIRGMVAWETLIDDRLRSALKP